MQQALHLNEASGERSNEKRLPSQQEECVGALSLQVWRGKGQVGSASRRIAQYCVAPAASQMQREA